MLILEKKKHCRLPRLLVGHSPSPSPILELEYSRLQRPSPIEGMGSGYWLVSDRTVISKDVNDHQPTAMELCGLRIRKQLISGDR